MNPRDKTGENEMKKRISKNSFICSINKRMSVEK